jgi:glycerol-3-phosphate dehydrogenase
MKRDLGRLTGEVFDVLVLGGGVHGACIAWDAALRGLSVALIDKGDFGHATSANSLKTLHGGLRYLQDPDLSLARTMIAERRAFMRIAPHLAHPLPCVMPLYGGIVTSKPVMAAALALNDAIGFDRNRLADRSKHLAGGRVISTAETLRLLPGARSDGLTGAAVWHECQVYNSERLTLSFVLSAGACGAAVANYVEAAAFLVDGNVVAGVRAKDGLTGDRLEIRARIVVNATGPWTADVFRLLGGQSPRRPVTLSRAMNLVTRQVISGHMLALRSHPRWKTEEATGSTKSRLFVLAPWREYSLLGTLHLPASGDQLDSWVEEQEIDDFVADFNLAYPGAGLSKDDIRFVHTGLLPVVDSCPADKVKLLRNTSLWDHRRLDGIEGLITVVGVKYSLSRRAARDAVDLALKKLGQAPRRCQTAEVSVAGGNIDQFSDFVRREIAGRSPNLPAETVRHLAYTYGSELSKVVSYMERDSTLVRRVSHNHEVTAAQIVHAIREEMAATLADVVFRRTELGSAGDPGEHCLRTCADIMAAELGWAPHRVAHELDEVRSRFAPAARTKVTAVSDAAHDGEALAALPAPPRPVALIPARGES